MSPSDRRYTSDHEWALRADDVVTIGITDYAQDQLGPVVYVDLPAIGSSVVATQSFGAVDSQKASSELFAPVSGIVVEVNSRLADNPELVNEDPYGEGWMIKARLEQPSEFESLLSAENYDATIGSGSSQ